MQSDSDPKIIAELKAAGEELKKATPPKTPVLTEQEQDEEDKSSTFASSKQVTAKVKEAELLNKIDNYQERIVQEQLALEKTYQEIKALEKKLEERIELLKRLQSKSKDFQNEIALEQKENNNLLDQIKNKLDSGLPTSQLGKEIDKN